MSGTLVVMRRELGALFFSPLAWILLFAALLLNGLLFSQNLALIGDVTASIEFVFGGNFLFWGLVIVLAPLVSMRLITEESSNGTLEYLRTAPLSDAAVITGKFLAGLTFMAVLWSSAFLYAGAVQLQGLSPDWGQLVAIYVGIILASGLFVALGMTACATTNTPLLGAFLAFMACLWWLLMPWLGSQVLPQFIMLFGANAKEAEDVLAGILDRMAVMTHFGRSYFQGVIDSSELVFFTTWTIFFLFLTTRALEARRWRG